MTGEYFVTVFHTPDETEVSKAVKEQYPNLSEKERLKLETAVWEMAKQGLSYESDVPYININLYFMPDEVYELHKWDLYFEKEGMSRLWEAGQAMEVMHVPMQLSKEVAELLLEKGRQSRELY